MIIPSPNPALTPISQPTMKSEEATHLLLVPNRLKIPNPLADHSTQFCIQPANVVQLGLGGKPVNRLVCLHFACLFVRISPLVISVMIYMMNPSGFYGFLLTKHGRYLFVYLERLDARGYPTSGNAKTPKRGKYVLLRGCIRKMIAPTLRLTVRHLISEMPSQAPPLLPTASFLLASHFPRRGLVL